MAQYNFASLRAEYADLWARMKVLKIAEADGEAKKVIANRARYEAVEKATGIPWFFVGCIHLRESNGNFSAWLHNGDPMRDRSGKPIQTTHVPAHRPPNPDESWEEGAYDALINCERLNTIKDWCPEAFAYASEELNGFGYRNPSRNIPSPYLWGGTNIQKPGKFVRDGVYDSKVMDPQIGTMAVLSRIMALCPDAVFAAPAAPTPQPSPVSVPPVSLPAPQPKATDVGTSTIRPATHSHIVWGSIFAWVSGAIGGVAGIFNSLNNPFALTAFLILVVLASAGFFLVCKGYVDVRALVEHLSEDDGA